MNTHTKTMIQAFPKMAALLPILGYLFLIIFGFLCLLLLWKMWRNEINLATLLDEANGDASMSRFQLLIFTLVIAVGIFLYIWNNLNLPNVPTSILTLLGISSSTYAAGKGIQFSRKEGLEKKSSPPADAAVQQSAADAQQAAASAQQAAANAQQAASQ